MRVRTTIEIETFKELEYLNELCGKINISARDACSTCVFAPRCVEDDALWMYGDITGPTPEIVKYRYDKIELKEKPDASMKESTSV